MDEAPRSRVDPNLGMTLAGRYRIERALASGGMGTVYAATDQRDGRTVAVKLLHAHHALDEEVVRRFRREAAAAAAVGSDHIVDVYDSGELDGGGVYLAMELLEGRDLGRTIREDGPMPIGRAVRLAMQVCDGVAAAHDIGIVHRDLKPENLFVVPRDGRDFVKVLDFGISKVIGVLDGVTANHTRTGTTLGTPHYMAPEQAQASKHIDERVDVYALGVILFRALSGQLPFDDPSLPLLILKICTEAPPAIELWRADVPPALAQAIERMLAKAPDQRFGDFRAVKAALAPFATLDAPPQLRDGPQTAEPTAQALSADATAPTLAAHPDDEPPAIAPGPSWPRILLFGLLGLAVLATVAFAFLGNDSPAEDIEDQLPDLPTPSAPIERTLVTRPAEDIGWSWLNPRPRAMPTWYAVDVAPGNLVAMAGEGGMAARYVDRAIRTWPRVTGATLRSIAWTGAREAIAVGERGTILHLSDAGAEVIASGVDGTLRDLVAISPTESIVVGDDGVVLRVAGDRVSRLDVNETRTLLAVAQVEDGVLMVGDGGVAIRLRLPERTAVRERTGVDTVLRALGGCPGGDLYAAGDQGALRRRRRRSRRWEAVRTTGPEPFTAVSCDHGRVAVARRDGSLTLVSGFRSVRMPTGFTRPWHAVAGLPEGASWLVGVGGRLATIERRRVRTLTTGPTVPLRALGSMGGALVAVGEWGRILRETEDGLAPADSPTEAGLAGLVQLGEGRLLAVGDGGELVDIRYDRAEALSSPTDVSLRDGVADEDGEVLLVGVGGTLVRGHPGGFRERRVSGASDFWAVTGTPDDAIAVGLGGEVWRIGDGTPYRLPCGTGRDLHDVARIDAGTWAVGANGVVVRVQAERCVVEREGGPALRGIGEGPYGRPIAVGDAGTVLERSDSGEWAPANVDVGRANLYDVWQGERDVFIAGSGGVLIRHVRLR